MPEERWLTRSEAAGFLRDRGIPIQASTLAKYATVGGGPMYVKFGRKPLYAESALLEWVRTKTTGPWRSSSDLEVRSDIHPKPAHVMVDRKEE